MKKRAKKLQVKTRYRILIAAAIGFGIAILIMAITIYFGYTKAYANGGDAYTVKLLGLEIYQLSRTDARYIGSSKETGANMGLICMICMILCIVAEEIIHKIKRYG